MSNRERIRATLMPLVTTFTGVGGLVFHAGHGSEHLVCMASAAMLAVGGALWSIYNRYRRPRTNFVPQTFHPPLGNKKPSPHAWCDQDPAPKE